MINDLEQFKKIWNFHRGHTLDLLKTLTDTELSFTIAQNMGTLGQQFRHLCRVDDQYITAIETRKVENNRTKLDFPIETSISKLLEQFQKNEESLFKVLSNMSEDELKSFKIDWTYWGEKEFGLFEHLSALVEHEILHHGELIVYFRILAKPFPKSWSAWGV